MHQSTDEEKTGLKDRERPRPNAPRPSGARPSVPHTRQTLGAVGRVASRVRNSGMRFSKANSLLQRQREEQEGNVNESPWGVGISAAAQVDKILSEESKESDDNEKPNVSPSADRKSDMVDLCSPLSAEQHSTPRLVEESLQNGGKEEESPRKERTTDRIGSDRSTDRKTERAGGVLGAAGAARAGASLQNGGKEEESPRKERAIDRIGSERRTDRKTERASGVLGAAGAARAGAARGLVKSVSKLGFRKTNSQGALHDLTKSKSTQGTLNDLTKRKSAKVSPTGNVKDTKSPRQPLGREILDTVEDVGKQPPGTKDHESSASASEPEGMRDTRTRGFHLPALRSGRSKHDELGNRSGLGRRKSRQEELGRSRTGEKLRIDVTRSRSKANVEKSRTKPGGGRSLSQAPSGSPRSNPRKASPSSSVDSGKGEEGKRSRGRKSFKEVGRRGRAAWFGLAGDPGESQMRGTSGRRGRSRTRGQQSGGEQDVECELGSRMSGKASKDLAEMQDFAIDEYFDSEEDDMESGSAPPSMADDDFISYQTGQGRKGQGNRSRSRIRMKPQS